MTYKKEQNSQSFYWLIKCDGNHQAYDFKKCEQSLTKQTILIRAVVAKNADNLEWFHIMSYSAY